MSPRRVGVLGGMGPEATILLMQKLVAAVPASDDGDHVPLIVDQNPQVPSRIAHLIAGTGESPAPVLAAMAARLERAGAEALAMPCNTAHHYADAIRQAVDIPFLDMVALSAEHAAALVPQGGRIGVLGSPALRQTALFDGPFAARGLTAVYPADETATLAAIREIKKSGPGDGVRAQVSAMARSLAEQNVAAIMVACTEFSLLIDSLAAELPVFDTLDCLADAVLSFADPARKL